jgi:hypothetical protein
VATHLPRLTAATAALVVVQVVHGVAPSDGDDGSALGAVGGLALLAASAVALVGLLRGRPWGRTLAGWTGAGVAVGFLLYHALPFKSPLTNPYWGPDVSVSLAQWLSVLAAMAVGAWCAWKTRGSLAVSGDAPAEASPAAG